MQFNAFYTGSFVSFGMTLFTPSETQIMRTRPGTVCKEQKTSRKEPLPKCLICRLLWMIAAGGRIPMCSVCIIVVFPWWLYLLWCSLRVSEICAVVCKRVHRKQL